MDFFLTIAGVFVVAGVLVVGSVVAGQQEELCKAMGGTYRNVAPPADQCPDGQFRNLVRKKPTPTK